jgi:putative redox protein
VELGGTFKVSSTSSIAQSAVVVRSTGSGFGQEIVTGQHRLKAGEPCFAGGTDTGPTPYQFLLAAFGACTSLTVGMYARRNNWALEGVVVRLSHSKIPAENCFACQTEEGMLDRIDCELELQGSLTPQQRLRLLDVAEKCPVHRTLTSEIEIQSRLV